MSETSDHNMRCQACGFTGDDVQDFVSTVEPGERTCPRCGSAECYTYTTPTTTTYQVIDVETGARLAGVASLELIEQSDAAEGMTSGAVLAREVEGVWYYVPASQADLMRVYEKAEVRTVYVEDVRGAETGGAGGV